VVGGRARLLWEIAITRATRNPTDTAELRRAHGNPPKLRSSDEPTKIHRTPKTYEMPVLTKTP
jgi:hypothetical protein